MQGNNTHEREQRGVIETIPKPSELVSKGSKRIVDIQIMVA